MLSIGSQKNCSYELTHNTCSFFVFVSNSLLDDNGLTGPIPSEIGMMMALTRLNLCKLID